MTTLPPGEIERRSFAIIDREAGEHGWPPDQWEIVRRMVHTTADFSWVTDTILSPSLVERGIGAIHRGRGLVTDTTMALSGINRRLLDRFGIVGRCLVSDPLVVRQARLLGVTRSTLAMRSAVAGGDVGIVVVGNAPTALRELIRLIEGERFAPDLVVALPVGFVDAAESKEEFVRVATERGIPFVSNRGRRGGSAVAAAVVNALLLAADRGR